MMSTSVGLWEPSSLTAVGLQNGLTLTGGLLHSIMSVCFVDCRYNRWSVADVHLCCLMGTVEFDSCWLTKWSDLDRWSVADVHLCWLKRTFEFDSCWLTKCSDLDRW